MWDVSSLARDWNHIPCIERWILNHWGTREVSTGRILSRNMPWMGYPGGSSVKNLPAKQEMWAWSLSQKDPLEEGMATHTSILDRKIPWPEEPGGLQSIVSQWVERDWSDLARVQALNRWTCFRNSPLASSWKMEQEVEAELTAGRPWRRF